MRFLSAFILIFALGVVPVVGKPPASKHSAPAQGNDAYLSRTLQGSNIVDMVEKCGVKPAAGGDYAFLDNMECRKVHASAIVKALGAVGATARSASRIVMRGLVVDGDLDLRATKVPFGLDFEDVTFLSAVRLDEASLDGDLKFERTTFFAGLSAVSLHTPGQLSFEQATVQHGKVDLSRSQIEGGATFSGCEFEANTVLVFRDATLARLELADNRNTFVLDARGATVGKQVKISGAQFAAGLDFEGAAIGGDFSLEKDARVVGKLSVRDATVKGSLHMTNVQQVQEVDANGLNAGRIDLDGSKIDGRADFSLCQVEGDFTIKRSEVGDLLAQKVDIRGSFYYEDNASKNAGVDLSAGQIGGDLFIRNSKIERNVMLSQLSVGKVIGFESGTSIKGSLQLGSAHIEGDLHIGEDEGGSVTVAAANFSLIHVLGNVFIHRATFASPPSFIGSLLDNHLDIAGATLPGLDLTRSQIKGDFRVASFQQQRSASWVPKQGSSLRYARIGFLQDDTDKLGGDPWPSILDLEGLTFDHFGTVRSVEWIESWLGRNVRPTERSSDEQKRSFQQQPYLQVGKHFLDEGDKESSDAVLFAAKDRETLTYWHTCADFQLTACGHGIWSALLRTLIGYGIGNGLFRVFYWVVIFTLVGALVLKFSSRPDGTRNPWCGKNPLWCIGASLSHLIPLVDLNKEFKDFFDDEQRERLRPWQLIYFGAHAMLGYLLATFVAAAVAGLTQGH